MFKLFRIVCTVLSALCLAAIVPAIVWLSSIYVIIDAVLALLFFVFMMLFKCLQESREHEKDGDAQENGGERKK